MAAYDISKIATPGGDELSLKDSTARTKIGNTDISAIADGTLTGAVSALANTVVGSFSYNASTGHLSYTPYSGSPYTFALSNGHLTVN